MASQKITAGIRDALITAAKDRKFKDDRVALAALGDRVIKERDRVGDLCYAALFTPHQRRLIDKIPKGWLPTTNSVRVNIAEVGVVNFSFNSTRPVPNSYNGYGTVAMVLESDHPVFTDREGLVKLEEELNLAERLLRERERALAAKVQGVIGSVTTTGRLKEIWPEVVKLLPMASQPVGDMLPMINLDDLNKELGID